MKNILLFKIGAIGDVLMTTPFVRQLKKQKSDITIDYMIWSKSAIVLKSNSYIHKLISFDESSFSSKNIFALWSFFLRIRKIKSQYDAVVIFDKHRIFSFMFKIAWYKKRIWFDRAGKDWKFLTDKILWNASQREVEYNLDLLKLLSYKPDYNDQNYDIDIESHNKQLDDLIKRLKTPGKKIIWISTWWGNSITHNIHGSKDCRRWSLDNRTNLTQKLLDQWYIVLLLWAISDRSLIINHSNFYNLLWKYTLAQSIYLIGKLDKIICHESGFMHLVGCTHTPVILLAWPTNPHRLYPYKHPWSILWKETKECYDLYGSYSSCKGNEIDKIKIQDILNCL